MAVEQIIDQIKWAITEGSSMSEIHELAWLLVNATREGESECKIES